MLSTPAIDLVFHRYPRYDQIPTISLIPTPLWGENEPVLLQRSCNSLMVEFHEQNQRPTPGWKMNWHHSPLLVSLAGWLAAPELSSSCPSSSPCRRTSPSPWWWPRSRSLRTVSSGGTTQHGSAKKNKTLPPETVRATGTGVLPWACCRKGSPEVASVRWWTRRALWRPRRPAPSSLWSSWPRCRWSGQIERRARRANASSLQVGDQKKLNIKPSRFAHAKH